MKRLMVLLFVASLAVAGCGGGGGPSTTTPGGSEVGGGGTGTGGSADDSATEPAAPNEAANLPQTVDVYSDGMFKYADPSLYEGSYSQVTDTAETCSAFLGVAMPQEALITDASATDLQVELSDDQLNFDAATQSDVGSYDMWGYTGSYKGRDCAIAFGSGNANGETLDLFGLSCVSDDLLTSCIVLYEKTSEHDFSSTTVKDVSGDEYVPAVFVNALQELVEMSVSE